MDDAKLIEEFEASSMRQQAMCLWLLAGLGLRDFSDLIDWADGQIRLHEQPPYPLIELALVRGDCFEDANHFIQQLPGELDTAKIASTIIPYCRDAFANGRAGLEGTLERCKSVCNHLDFSQETWYKIDKIDDDRLLEEQGIWDHGTTRKYLLEFLDQYSNDSAWRKDETQ